MGALGEEDVGGRRGEGRGTKARGGEKAKKQRNGDGGRGAVEETEGGAKRMGGEVGTVSAVRATRAVRKRPSPGPAAVPRAPLPWLLNGSAHEQLGAALELPWPALELQWCRRTPQASKPSPQPWRFAPLIPNY